MKNKLIIIFLFLTCPACTHHQNRKLPTEVHQHIAAAEETTYDPSLVENVKDPFCRMPVKMGVYDTVHYKGNVIGFCSPSCKDSFMLQPEKYELVLKKVKI